MSSSTAEIILPDYYPGVFKSCQDVSDQLFQCINLNSVKKDDNDVSAGVEGVLVCKKELQAYKSCMEKHLPKIESKRFRVSKHPYYLTLRFSKLY
jgi:hypothetical protein